MHEIISISCGQYGNSISSQFWQILLHEHGINDGIYRGDSDIQFERINIYFNEKAYYYPRTIMIDLEPGMAYAPIFHPDNFIQGQFGTQNNWAKGFYTEGAELIDEALDAVRKQAEPCDMLQGFQMTHSLGGGTGSGMGALVSTKLRDEYPDAVFQTFSVMPSLITAVEPYNAILGLNQLIDSSDGNTMFENYDHVAQAMSEFTSCFRFPNKINQTMRKMSLNMNPISRLHFYISRVVPLTIQYRALTDPEICQSLFDHQNGKWLAAVGTFRGRRGPFTELHYQIQNVLNKNKSLFIDWIPDNFKYQLIDIPPKGLKCNGSVIANSTCIQEMFTKIIEEFSSLFKRKAFLHWYTIEGMEEMEFIEAESEILDLIYEYQQYQNIQDDESEQSDGD